MATLSGVAEAVAAEATAPSRQSTVKPLQDIEYSSVLAPSTQVESDAVGSTPVVLLVVLVVIAGIFNIVVI